VGDRLRPWFAGGLWLTVIGIVTVAAAHAERFPVRWGLGLTCVVIASLGAAITAARWGILAVAPAPFLMSMAVVTMSDTAQPLGTLAAGVALAAVALGCFTVGVPLGRRLGPRASNLWPAVLLGLVPIPLAHIDRDATVRVHRAEPVVLDLRLGGYRGAHLGMTISEVQAVLGPGRRTSKDDGTSPSFESAGDFGPSSLQVTGHELSYPGPVIFDLDARGRVEMIEVGDRRAVVSPGVGVGDSISLAEDALPGIRCGEGALGSDEPTYFPQCTARMGSGLRVYLSAPYSVRGAPIAIVVLSRAERPRQ